MSRLLLVQPARHPSPRIIRTLHLMTADELKGAIGNAFAGVTLSGGVSLRQSEAIDDRRELSSLQFARLSDGECINEWQKLSPEELESRPNLAHMDSLGFRYYIPAFMCSVVDNPIGESMTMISTLGGLYPKTGDSWQYHLNQYAALSDGQKKAIALFLDWLLKCISLHPEDKAIVLRAIRNYWGQYLENK